MVKCPEGQTRNAKTKECRDKIVRGRGPCPEGQTRNAKTKECRDKLKTGRRARSASASSASSKRSLKKNWTNLAALRANINARTEAAIQKTLKKGSAKTTPKGSPKTKKNWTNLAAIKANINARTEAAVQKTLKKKGKSPNLAKLIAKVNAKIVAQKFKEKKD